MIITKQNQSKTNIYQKLAEPNLYQMLKEMGNSKQAIDKFQKNRIMQTLFVFITLFTFGLFLSKWFYIVSLIVAVIVYKQRHKQIVSKYSSWKFQRHLQFSKFTRLLIPYLKQSKGNASLYNIFNKILLRTENEADKNSLYTLMSKMSSDSGDIEPFIEFAERSSGTDMSILFMSTIFDFQQSTFDTTVIDELGKIASEELMTSIDEIIGFKLKRFAYFPTKIVMSSFVLVMGFALGVLLSSFSEIQF
uniref:hypothetical protein n=1 Tax=Carnobacterium sp. TaxID=48221 RepID=UPI00344EEEAE